MKIEEIELINLRYAIPPARRMAYAGGQITGRLTSLVRVTASDGQVGWGSAYSHPELVRIVIEDHLKPLLLGDDPREVEALWSKMYQATRWYGRKGAALSALGALDIAFWDLRGKALGKSVQALLGGSSEKVPAYASALLWSDSLEALGREAAGYVDQGYRRMKMRLGKDEDYDVAAVRAVRQAVGSSVDVIVDASMRYSLEVAQRLARVLEENRVFWYEEPFEPEDIDNYVALRRLCNVPIAAGENEFGLQGFREMLRAGALDIVQPDCCRAGGITECHRIGQMAERHQARVATHTWSDALALTANMHVVAALPNGLTVEVDRTGNPFIDDLLVEPHRIEEGFIRVPRGPGLGVELKESVIRRWTLPASQRLPSGAYSDMSFGKEYWVHREPY